MGDAVWVSMSIKLHKIFLSVLFFSNLSFILNLNKTSVLLGWSFHPGPSQAGKFPAIFITKEKALKKSSISIDEYNYLWTTEKNDSVLVNTEFGYGIVNKRKQTVLSISDESISKAVVQKMLDEGNKTYDSILDAYDDV